MTLKRFGILLMLTLFVSAGVLSAQENYAQWGFNRTITLNTSATGANVASTVINFPVLVRLTAKDSTVFITANANGSDVRFAKANGTPLKYQIERWDATNKKAELWVRMDTIYGNATTTTLKMYWGKSGTADSSKANAVFDTTNKFSAVWHLGENAGDTTKDATYNNFYGVATGTTSGIPASVEGIIGKARSFTNGTTSDSGYITIEKGIDGSKLDLPYQSIYTVSGWFNMAAYPTKSYHILSRGDRCYATQIQNGRWKFGEYNAGWHDSWGDSAFVGQWAHIAVVSDGSTSLHMFTNGVQIRDSLVSTGTGTRTGYAFLLGKRGDNNTSYYYGLMDEVRIDSGVARSGDWIKLCYQNQRADSAQTLVALGTINHTATGPYAAWFSSKNIVLNTKATGANVSTTITNFPVLVRLSSNNAAIFSGAKSNGADIRFAKANGTALPYQIEQWNATSKKAAVWVLVDTIKGNDSLASIIMYYGNSSAIDSSSPGKVFDTSKGFQAVYHFSDAADTAFDATINKYTASPVTTAPADTIGIIGRARYFDGSASAYDIVGSSDSSGIFNKLHFPDNGIYTLSAWVNLTSITGLPAIIARGSGGASEYHLYTRAATTEFRFLENRSTTDGGQQYLGSGTGTAVTGIWTHVVGVRNGINMSLFLNGAVIASPTTGATGGTRTITYDVNIGRRSDGSNYFNGFIDEVQIANVARDTNWIKLSYENQKASQTLVFVEGTTNSIASQPVVSGSITLQNGTTVQLKVPGRASIACHLATANLSGVKMSIVDLYGRTVWSKTFSSSTREVSWNGETMSGNRAVAGTYIVRLTALGATNATADQKILLMK